jgi:pSer/pThr/pTyr-binding forkhead associated (FHA) protein
MQAFFTVISGPHHGQTFQIPRGKFIIGREADCHLLLDSNSVSRHHCVLLLDEYTLRVRDLASKNGTFVNRDQTRLGERILVHGDTVRVGDMVIRVDLESGSDSSGAASLETKDIEPETQRLDGRPAQEPQANQPFPA